MTRFKIQKPSRVKRKMSVSIGCSLLIHIVQTFLQTLDLFAQRKWAIEIAIPRLHHI